MTTTSAIYVRDVVKHYGDNIVLDGLSLTVERGTIYGLLGSSGCGKTTLLSCIVGKKGINSGEIWVLGTQKGAEVLGPKVGYMPQELALVEEFTIRDTIYYFGTIFNMKNKEINERLVELTNLLDLPPEDRFLKHCSGGQKRRVSFAAAMVHSPELLILDEPTVGIDPILREKIWDYLKDQVNKKRISVVITTHYIEETREANKIGLMRGGRLLTEESPTKLLSMYRADTLEQVFLTLSQKQEREGNHSLNDDRYIGNINDQNRDSVAPVSTSTSVESFTIGYGSQDELTESSKRKKPRANTPRMSALNFNENRMKALLDKNWKQFYRNVEGFLFLLAFPILQLSLFTHSVGTDPKGLDLGIVNHESFTTLCNDIDSNHSAVLINYECHFKNLTCRYLRYLEDPMINKVSYKSLPEAVEGVKHGKIVGILYIPSNFTAAYEERVNLGADAKEWTTDFGEMKAYIDMSNKLLGPILGYKMLSLFIDFQKKLMAECNLSEKLAEVAVRSHYMYVEEKEPMTIFVTPGMVLTLVFLLGCTMTSNIIVKDKIDGVWDRSIVAGVSSLEITLAHLFLEGAVMFVQSIESVIMLFFVLKYDCAGDIFALFLIVYLVGLCGMAYGFCISSLSNGITQANFLCTGGYLSMLLIGGIIWPIEAMPVTLRMISLSLPCTMVILSFRNVMSKGWSLWDPQVINGVGITFSWIVIFAVTSIWFIKIKK